MMGAVAFMLYFYLVEAKTSMVNPLNPGDTLRVVPF